MINIFGKNFNELFINSIFYIYSKGDWVKARGFKFKELIAPNLVLDNPRECLCTISDRKLNYSYLIIEKFTYLSQISYPEAIIAYNSKMINYLNPKTKDFDGAYGLRIAKNKQLDHCYELLKEDKGSRQAVITINDYTDRRKSLDKACTLSLQFLIRKNKLHLITTMRSNDLMFGTSLDIPAFCFLQEVMLSWLKETYPTLKLGQYIHKPASFHYYDYSEKQLLELLKLNQQDDTQILNINIVNDKKTPKWDISYKDTKKALKLFWKEEVKIRKSLKFKTTGFKCIDEYLNELLNYNVKKYEQRKNGKK